MPRTYGREVALGLLVALACYALALQAVAYVGPLWGDVLVLQAGFLAAAILCVILTRSGAVERLALRGLPWRSLALAIAGAAALHLVLRVAFPLIERLLEPMAPESVRKTREFSEVIHAELRERPLVTLLAITTLPALCEEALFRGWFLPLRARPAVALVVSSLIFALVHVHAPRVLVTLVLGLYFGAVLLATRSLWAAVAAHGVNNLLAVMLPESHPIDVWVGLAALPAFALTLWLLRVRAAVAER